jgi:hypothetical protein
MARAVIGLFLALHGVAHAVGFTASWRLAASAEAPYTTSILNGLVDVGDAGIRIIGVLWLVAALAMLAAAVQVWRRSPHAVAAVLTATAFSFVMCLVGLPAAQIGAGIDLVILGVVASAGLNGAFAREPA